MERQPRCPERTRCREGASGLPLEDKIKDKDVTRFFGGLKMLVFKHLEWPTNTFTKRKNGDLSGGTAERAGVGVGHVPKGHQCPTHLNHILANLQRN